MPTVTRLQQFMPIFLKLQMFSIYCVARIWKQVSLGVQHMSTHVRNCLLSGKFESFPMLSRNKNQLYDNTDFNAQHRFQNIHQDQQEIISGPNVISKDNKEQLKEKDKMQHSMRRKLMPESEKGKLR